MQFFSVFLALLDLFLPTITLPTVLALGAFLVLFLFCLSPFFLLRLICFDGDILDFNDTVLFCLFSPFQIKKCLGFALHCTTCTAHLVGPGKVETVRLQDSSIGARVLVSYAIETRVLRRFLCFG